MKEVHKNIIFSLATILLFVATSCNDMYKGCKNMPEQTDGSGLILKNVRIWYSSYDYTTINNTKEGQIITSDSENIFDLVVSFDNGLTYHPIDFSQYTVLGIYTDGSCRIVYDRNVIKNIEMHKYIYKITVIHCGLCEELATSMNWVLIPKIENDFTIEFVVEHKQWNNGR